MPSSAPRGRTPDAAGSTDFDAVVIGSGFGGAPVACRLAEAGYRVLVLERGRRWTKEQYPRRAGDAWIYDHEHPERHDGWLDFRFYDHIAVVMGAGVGGGSLHYANVSITAQPDLFEWGWPKEITYAGLLPYYDRVAAMLTPMQIPDQQRSARTLLLKRAAEATGNQDYFRKVELAVNFDPDYAYDTSREPNVEHSRWAPNKFGAQQGTCVHLGNCVIGCEVQARNTLDLNYLRVAEQRGAEVRPLHLVQRIEPVRGGYAVRYDEVVGGARRPGRVTARVVVSSGGSLGSTELLLRCRSQFKTLPGISPRVGHAWCCNTNYLTLAEHPGVDVRPTRGPTISAAIDFFGDHPHQGERFIIEDGGVPDFVRALFSRRGRQPGDSRRYRQIMDFFIDALGVDLESRHVMPWFSQGRDQSVGTFKLRRAFLGLFGPQRFRLDWPPSGAEKVTAAIIDMHEKLARATDGKPMPPFVWKTFKAMITPHPLGGCNMAARAQDGVVDHQGEVFGYRNLFVSDGAIVPRAIGHNPSKTIAALGERIAERIVAEGR